MAWADECGDAAFNCARPCAIALADFVVTDHLVDAGAVRQSGMGAARGNVREDEEAHIIAVMTGHDDILRQRR